MNFKFHISLLLLLAGFASAFTLDDLMAGIAGKEAPDFIKGLVGSNVIQAYVSDGSATQYYWLKAENGKVASAGRGRLLSPSPTVLAWSDKATVGRILSSQTPLADTRKALDDGRIKVDWKGNLAARLSFGLLRALPFPLPDGPIYPPYSQSSTPALAIPPANPAFNPQIGPYPGFKACEFYQISQSPPSNKKLVTCAAYKAGDTFCAVSMQSRFAKAVVCSDQMVVCTIPCASSSLSLRCAFDINRPRGANAAPLDFCPQPPPIAPAQKKAVGALCAHGGECATGNCVGDGMGPPWVYRCSCNPFRMAYNC